MPLSCAAVVDRHHILVTEHDNVSLCNGMRDQAKVIRNTAAGERPSI